MKHKAGDKFSFLGYSYLLFSSPDGKKWNLLSTENHHTLLFYSCDYDHIYKLLEDFQQID